MIKNNWIYHESFTAVPLDIDAGVWGLMKDGDAFGTLILYLEPKIKAKMISFSDFIPLTVLMLKVQIESEKAFLLKNHNL